MFFYPATGGGQTSSKYDCLNDRKQRAVTAASAVFNLPQHLKFYFAANTATK